MRFLSCGVSDFPKFSGNFRGRSEEFQSSEVSRCVWDRLKKNSPQGFFSFKIGEPGIKHDLHLLFLSQIRSSLHFYVVNGSFKAY